MSKDHGQNKMLCLRLNLRDEFVDCMISEQEYENIISGVFPLNRQMVKVSTLEKVMRGVVAWPFCKPKVVTFDGIRPEFLKYYDKFYYVNGFTEIQTASIEGIDPLDFEHLYYSEDEMLEVSKELLLEIYENNVK